MLIADGIKGLCLPIHSNVVAGKSFSEVYRNPKQQSDVADWVHKMLNILDKVPQHVQPKMKEDLSRQSRELREIYYSRSKEKSEKLINLFFEESFGKEKYRTKYPKAVESLQSRRGRASMEKGIKTTNPLEFIFATVKLKKNAARRINPDLVGIVSQLFI